MEDPREISQKTAKHHSNILPLNHSVPGRKRWPIFIKIIPCYASSSSSSSSSRMDSLWWLGPSNPYYACFLSEKTGTSPSLWFSIPFGSMSSEQYLRDHHFPSLDFQAFDDIADIVVCIMMSSGLDCPAYSQLQHQFNQPKPVLLRSSKSTFIFLHHHGLPLPCKEEQQARLLRLPLACFTIIEMFFSIKINRHLFVNNV